MNDGPRPEPVAVRPLALAGPGTAPFDLQTRLAEDHGWRSLGAPGVRTLLVSPCLRMTLERSDRVIGNRWLKDALVLAARRSPGDRDEWWAAFSPRAPYELATAFVLGATELLVTDPDSVLSERPRTDVVELLSNADWTVEHGSYRTTIGSPGSETGVLHHPDQPWRPLSFSMLETTSDLAWSVTMSPQAPAALITAMATALADGHALRRPDEIPAHHAHRIRVESADRREKAALVRSRDRSSPSPAIPPQPAGPRAQDPPRPRRSP
ncbi:hypothetical protein ACFVUH_08265 [Kitasatospora sp. NPDC058032]|uniref:hypothetical protein n=1 Tax=Kitasatospora sp. NPDC058032 TaxID=3346307 RepID=UPI0036D7F18A